MEKLTAKVLSETFQYEIPKIKGSRFITTLIPISSKEQMEESLLKIKKNYFDATHNCYAWRLGLQAQQDLFGNWSVSSEQERANDDEEPSNTAGKPILNVLSGQQVFEVLAVVTRYFGGTLLGVGGLIQAYTESTKAALLHAPFAQKEITKKLTLQYRYDQLSLVQYFYNKYEIQVISENFDTTITQEIRVNIVFYEIMKKELLDKQIICS
jgi:hypothetical protein